MQILTRTGRDGRTVAIWICSESTSSRPHMVPFVSYVVFECSTPFSLDCHCILMERKARAAPLYGRLLWDCNSLGSNVSNRHSCQLSDSGTRVIGKRFAVSVHIPAYYQMFFSTQAVHLISKEMRNKRRGIGDGRIDGA